MLKLVPLAVCLALGSAVSAYGHTSDGKPCPPVEDIDIRAELEETIGLPVLHDDEIDPDMITIGCKDRFCFAHNSESKAPVWVAEKMTRAIACGDNKRPSGWKAEDVGGLPRATNEDYTHSGYARGHNAASDDFKSSRDWMKQTFTFANSVPQIQDGFNGSYWRFLEEDVKHLALSGHDIYVITGPIPLADDGKPFSIEPAGQSCRNEVPIAGKDDLKQPSICGGTKADGPNQDCQAGVDVPAGMFKIIYLVKYNRLFAYAASNIDHRPLGKKFSHHDDYIETWRVSVRDIEELTNLEFFPELDKRQMEVAKNSCITTPKH
ncbi:DNA/RNA non-specific endonuclease [Hoeflea sp.]|uniref:DNA/RNA non-specific endonuclease n=1 Tax=Hoeflea sp. TaxID=1940281 RepID=UPI003B020C82